jgi:alpha-methylacyl-CoA racemase
VRDSFLQTFKTAYGALHPIFIPYVTDFRQAHIFFAEHTDLMTDRTLNDIFESIPSRFRPEKADGYDAVFHFDFGNVQYAVTLSSGRCTVRDGLAGVPTCTVKTEAQTYVQLEMGELSPQTALLTGAVKVSDISEMMRFAKCFRKYTAAEHNVATSRTLLTGPLVGYRILDLTKLLPGPLATLWLAQHGAEVIKIEDPNSPDPIRDYPPLDNGISVFHSALNSGKKSLAIDFRCAKGKEVIERLVKDSDVVIEQFRPGVLKAFGLGYDVLRQWNPKVILVSITGYGQIGPLAGHPGHDINYLSYSGLLHGLRDSDGEPIMPTAQLADVAGGSMMALNAVTLSLLHRERTGEGQHVDVAMTDSLPYLHMLRWAEENATERYHGHLSGRMACYNVYRCSDGEHLALGALEPKFWKRFCMLVDRPDWEHRIIESDQTYLIAEVAAMFSERELAYWTAKLEHQEVCLSPVLSLRQASVHPHFHPRGFPPPMGNARVWSAASLGADNHAILTQIGYTDEEIASMSADW